MSVVDLDRLVDNVDDCHQFLDPETPRTCWHCGRGLDRVAIMREGVLDPQLLMHPKCAVELAQALILDGLRGVLIENGERFVGADARGVVPSLLGGIR